MSDSKKQPLLESGGDAPKILSVLSINNNSEVSHQSLQARSRPVSLYDNLRSANSNNNGTSSNLNSSSLTSAMSASEQNISLNKKQTNFSNVDDGHDFQKYTMDRSPSQAIYLSTTVPQNMAASAISGRHTPTRNSLRHSRMIVMSRGGKVPRKYLPHVLRPYRLATALSIIQLLTGVAIAILALWLLLWAPNADARHNPYWSGLTLAISGSLGLFLLGCCRKEYPGMPKEYCVAAFKVISVLASLLAAMLCFTACLYAVLHLFSLSGMTCEPSNVLNSTCMCRPIVEDLHHKPLTSIEINQSGNKSEAVMTVVKPTHRQIPSHWYHYKDLNCPEVEGAWTIMMMVSAVLNGIGVVVCLVFIYLFWASRKDYLYAKVRTRDNGNIVIHRANS